MDPKAQTIDTRERVRKSFDKIKVFNPFDVDKFTIWDGFAHNVPAHGYAILDRFLADKWLEERCKEIITDRADKAVKDENIRRVTNGMAEMDKTRKTGEQMNFEAPYYANWTVHFAEVVKEFGLYGGIQEEYGSAYNPQAPVKTNQLYTSLIDDLEKGSNVPPVQETPVVANPVTSLASEKPSIIDNLESKSQPELRSIAKQKGILTHNTDKKADLIRMISQ